MTVTLSKANLFKDLSNKFKELESVVGRAGWLEGQRYPAERGGKLVAEVALTQEEGTEIIPARPFIKPAIAKNKAEWIELIIDGVSQFLDNKMTARQVMMRPALKCQSDIVYEISQIYSPPLSLYTIMMRYARRKAQAGESPSDTVNRLNLSVNMDFGDTSTKPLIDTSLMISTVTSVVEDV